MAIDPRISLMLNPLNVAQPLQIFNQVRQQQIQNERQARLEPLQTQMMQQSLQQGEQSLQAGELSIQAGELQNKLAQMGIETQQDLNDLNSVAQFSRLNRGLFESGDIAGVTRELVNRKTRLQQQGRDTTQTDEMIQLLNSQGLEGLNQKLLATEGFAKEIEDGKRDFAVKSSAPVTDPRTGQVSIPTFDPNTNQATLQPIEGLILETPEQKRESELKLAQAKKIAELKAKRVSDITKELGDRNRSAARSQRPLKQALKLVSQAEQGLTGAVKLQLSRLLPGVDASDEAALSATLNQLALEQLQQFKGPTTDFEFGVTQNIAGTLGQSREANEARIKSLDRANWFNQREFKQFQEHVDNGGDPDAFAFNFGEPIKTKKGVFTLQDIQDTAVENNLTIEETLKRLNK